MSIHPELYLHLLKISFLLLVRLDKELNDRKLIALSCDSGDPNSIPNQDIKVLDRKCNVEILTEETDLADGSKKDVEYKKAGVIVMWLVPNNKTQLNIFEKENPKYQILMKTLDFITKKEGPNKIKLASQDLKRVWKMKQTKLSSRYTTELKEIIALK